MQRAAPAKPAVPGTTWTYLIAAIV